MMTEEVFARAQQLTGELDEQQAELLSVLCDVSVAALEARLKAGVRVEDCQETFVTAASLLALADWNVMTETIRVEEFKAGDLTVKQGSGRNPETVGRKLQQQAERLMAPWLQDRFHFLGV